jgi:hypothetical protein
MEMGPYHGTVDGDEKDGMLVARREIVVGGEVWCVRGK